MPLVAARRVVVRESDGALALPRKYIHLKGTATFEKDLSPSLSDKHLHHVDQR